MKRSITPRQAAEFHGIKLNKGNFARCPFHLDDSPSFKIYDDGFYCFGCHEHGDVIDFVSKLFGLDAKEAAEKLAADFGIGDIPFCQTKPVRPEKADGEKNRERLNQSWNILCEYLHLLRDWKTRYMPDREDEKWHPLFCEALQNIDRVDYLLDCIWDCQASEAPALLEEIGGVIERYRKRNEQAKGSEMYGYNSSRQGQSAVHEEQRDHQCQAQVCR